MNEVHVNWKCNIIIVHHCAVCNSISCSSFTMMDMDLGVVASATTNWHPSNTPRSVYKTHGSIYLRHRAYNYLLCLHNTTTFPLGMTMSFHFGYSKQCHGTRRRDRTIFPCSRKHTCQLLFQVRSCCFLYSIKCLKERQTNVTSSYSNRDHTYRHV